MPETIVTAQAVERRMRVGKFLIGTAAMRQRLIFSSSTMVNSVATLAVRYQISWLVVTKSILSLRIKEKSRKVCTSQFCPF